jgi:hypothetical protein
MPAVPYVPAAVSRRVPHTSRVSAAS